MKRKIWVLTLFPEYFSPLMSCGVIGKTLSGERGDSIEFEVIQVSDYSPKGFKGVDGHPYGGGPGMIMRADVLQDAFLDGVVRNGDYDPLLIKSQLEVIYTSPRGEVWNHDFSKSYGNLLQSGQKDLVFICGRYEGVDERFLEKYVDKIYSLGDFVLSGGELAVMSMIDSSLRFYDGSLGNDKSAEDDSFEDSLIENAQYTRPQLFEGLSVPKVLVSGDHKKIKEFQLNEKRRMTKKFRPDLYEKYLNIEED